MMISGTTIVWCGTQDSTIMDGRHTSGIFTVQTKFPPMLQLPVRAIIAICLRHILPSARESRSNVRPWLSWRISAQLVWRLDWTYMRDLLLAVFPRHPGVLVAHSLDDFHHLCADIFGVEHFWNSIAFYNYVQVPMAGARGAPSISCLFYYYKNLRQYFVKNLTII